MAVLEFALWFWALVSLGACCPGVLDEPSLMSTANVFRVAKRRLSKSATDANPFEGKQFYVNPTYRWALGCGQVCELAGRLIRVGATGAWVIGI